jgi:Helix-turn-helix domain
MTVTTSAKTLSVPEAGREYFGLCRNAAYVAARRGDIPTIKIGKLLRVPVRALEQKLNATLNMNGDKPCY